MTDYESHSFWRHRMGKFAVFVLCLFGLWFGGWFVAAQYADGKIDEIIGQLKDRGTEIECSDKRISGFPFRMGLNCTELRFGGTRTGPALKTGTLRSTAILYDPTEMISELDSPAQLWVGGSEINIDWDRMRLYSDVTLAGGYDRLSLTFSDVEIEEGEGNAKLKSGSAHTRPNPDAPDDLDIAINLEAFQASLFRGRQIDSVDVALDASVENGYAMFVRQRRKLRQVVSQGLNVAFRSVKISVPNGGALILRGPVSIDEFGILSGDLEIGVANPDSLKRWSATINNDFSNGLGILAAAVASTGKDTKIGGTQVRSIRLKIDSGSVRLGFIELLRIPPLQL